MPVPSSIADLFTTPASNSPAGSESPNTVDDYLRTHAAFIKQTHDALPSSTNPLPTANLADGAVTPAKLEGGGAPASDVYTWAKQSTKPSYTKAEVGLGNVDNTADSVKSVATAVALTTASGSAPSYSARAWVNFNGTGTVSIRASQNVSSITDNGTGDYTVNFLTAMPDANYAAVGASVVSLSQSFLIGFIPADFTPGSFRFMCEQEGVNRADTAYNLVTIFR